MPPALPGVAPPSVKDGTRSESLPGNPEEGVPGVTVTPPTPPASESLGKAAGAAVGPDVGAAVAKVGGTENGSAAVKPVGGEATAAAAA